MKAATSPPGSSSTSRDIAGQELLVKFLVEPIKDGICDSRKVVTINSE